MIYTASLKGPRNGNKKRSQHRVVFTSALERSEGERRPTALATEPRLARPAGAERELSASLLKAGMPRREGGGSG